MRPQQTIRQRRGSVAIVVLLAVMLAGLLVAGLVQAGARDQDLSVRRLETVQAFYAAEAGMNMAIRELMENADEDLDGTIGTISDDGNDANDPDVGSGKVMVDATVSGGQTTVRSHGRSGESRRTIETVTE